jgi:hypothetical protein
VIPGFQQSILSTHTKYTLMATTAIEKAITATFKAPQKEIDLRQYRKENRFTEQFSAISGTKEVVCARWYVTPSAVYCCVWVYSPHQGYLGEYPEQYPYGGGKTEAYGEHMRSKAFSRACTSAGYTFDMEVGGRGDDMVKRAMLAICERLGFANAWIHEAHG